MDNNARESFDCKRVILAAGAIGSARIALRSLDLYGQPIPILLKPHLFIPCLHPRMLGKAGPAKRSSLCQLIMVDAKRSTSGFEGFCAQLYGYRSLLLFRLLGSVPLPAPEAMAMLSILSPALLIADVRFPLQHAHGATLTLERNGWTDKVHIQHPAQSLTKEYAAEIARLKKALRATGVYPLKTMELPEGSTSHYAGTIPLNGSGAPACDSYGRVRGEEGVYVADASAFAKLTAKPHTLTIMAYANRTGEMVAEDCRNG